MADKTLDSFPRIQLGTSKKGTTTATAAAAALLFPPEVSFASGFLESLHRMQDAIFSGEKKPIVSRLHDHLAYLCHLEPFLSCPVYATLPSPTFPAPFVYVYCEQAEKRHASPMAEFAVALMALTTLLLEQHLVGAASLVFAHGVQKLEDIKKDSLLHEHLDHAGIRGGIGYLVAIGSWLKLEAETITTATNHDTSPLAKLDLIASWKARYASLGQDFHRASDKDLCTATKERCIELDERRRQTVLQMARKSMELAETLPEDQKHAVMINYYHLHARDGEETKKRIEIEMYKRSQERLLLPLNNGMAAPSVEEAIQAELKRAHWQKSEQSVATKATSSDESSTNIFREWQAESERFKSTFPKPIPVDGSLSVLTMLRPMTNNAIDLARALVMIGRLQAPDALADKETLEAFRKLAIQAGVHPDALVPLEVPFRGSEHFSAIPASKLLVPAGPTKTEVFFNNAGQWIKSKIEAAVTPPTSPKFDTFATWFKDEKPPSFEEWKRAGTIPPTLDAFFPVDMPKEKLVKALTSYTPAQWASIGLTKAHLDICGMTSPLLLVSAANTSWTHTALTQTFGYPPPAAAARPSSISKPAGGIRTINKR